MQTFLPVASFARTAEILDRQRLGKQRVETLQILHAIALESMGIKAAWQNHPAAVMWKPFPWMLIHYGQAMCREWTARGYSDSCMNKIGDFGKVFGYYAPVDSAPFPETLYTSHRAALLAKFPAHYGNFGWNEVPEIRYFWPKIENR